MKTNRKAQKPHHRDLFAELREGMRALADERAALSTPESTDPLVEDLTRAHERPSRSKGPDAPEGK